MPKYLPIIFVLLPSFVIGQSQLAKRYVDDRINELTYLHFKTDNMFEFRYAYDLRGDEAIGRYIQRKDTLLLTFTKDTSVTGNTYFESASNVRADSLIIKGNKLYVIKNGQSREFERQDTLHHKPTKSERGQYRRRYLLFGYWYTHWSRYYMIDERHAKWATHTWLREHKNLFD
jgi:hypothetical protein